MKSSNIYGSYCRVCDIIERKSGDGLLSKIKGAIVKNYVIIDGAGITQGELVRINMLVTYSFHWIDQFGTTVGSATALTSERLTPDQYEVSISNESKFPPSAYHTTLALMTEQAKDSIPARFLRRMGINQFKDK